MPKHSKRHHASHPKSHGQAPEYMAHKHADMFNDEHHHQDLPTRMGHMIRDDKYAGPEQRLRQEYLDASMIHEDHRAVSNLPQEVIFRPYPDTRGYTPAVLNDTIEGVDRQTDYDNSQKMRHIYPKKV